MLGDLFQVRADGASGVAVLGRDARMGRFAQTIPVQRVRDGLEVVPTKHHFGEELPILQRVAKVLREASELHARDRRRQHARLRT